MLWPIILLAFSNLFMTYAWYGHLKDLKDSPLWIAIFGSWAVALLEYALQVPANRIGIQHFSLAQLKVLQEIINLVIFAGFAVFYMKVPLTKNMAYAGLCLVAAAWFIFKDRT